jgi:hypothetical protein
LPGQMGQASPQPMVITTSATCTLPVVSGLGQERQQLVGRCLPDRRVRR